MQQHSNLDTKLMEEVDYRVDSASASALSPMLRTKIWRNTGSAVGYQLHVMMWHVMDEELKS